MISIFLFLVYRLFISRMTLTQTERGYAPPFEHMGMPNTIKKSVGTDWCETRRIASIHYPWLRSQYLQKRKQQLYHVIEEINPHTPVCYLLLHLYTVKRLSTHLMKKNGKRWECDGITKIFHPWHLKELRVELMDRVSLQGPNDNSMLDMLMGYSCIQIRNLSLSLSLLLTLRDEVSSEAFFYSCSFSITLCCVFYLVSESRF